MLSLNKINKNQDSRTNKTNKSRTSRNKDNKTNKNKVKKINRNKVKITNKNKANRTRDTGLFINKSFFTNYWIISVIKQRIESRLRLETIKLRLETKLIE